MNHLYVCALPFQRRLAKRSFCNKFESVVFQALSSVKTAAIQPIEKEEKENNRIVKTA